MAKNYLYLIHLPVEKSEKPISNFNSIGWLYIEKKKKKPWLYIISALRR